MAVGDRRCADVARGRWLAASAAVALTALAACALPHATVFPFRFTADPRVGAPPMRGLLLWLGGDDSLVRDRSGRGARWADARGQDRAVVQHSGFTGTRVSATFATPSGPVRHMGLRCAA